MDSATASSEELTLRNEELPSDLNELSCAVCFAWGKLNTSSRNFTGKEDDDCLWKIYNSYDGIASAGELPMKIRSHFPEVPTERLEPLNTVICTTCFAVVHNVLQIEKQMLQVKAKLLVIKPGSEPVAKCEDAPRMQTRAKRKCAQGGLPQEIIQAELGGRKVSSCSRRSHHLEESGQPSNKRCKLAGNRSGEEKKKPVARVNLKSSSRKKEPCPAKVESVITIVHTPIDGVALNEKDSEMVSKKACLLTEKPNRKINQVTYPPIKGKLPSRDKGSNKKAEGSNDNFFCCPKCCQYFPQNKCTEFRTHLTEECFVKKRIPCHLCGHIYSTQNILDYHMLHVHVNPHPKSKTFKIKPRKEYVDTVNKLATFMSQDPFDTVNGTYSSETLLKSCKELEEDEWPEDETEAEKMAAAKGIWKCWICFYESKQKSLWNTHMNRIHPDAVGISLTCETCGISFTKKFHLREHIHEVHADNTGYTCEDCGRKFTHKNMQHVCEKIQCNICGETFDSRGLKSKHMLVHPEFRPFKCELCSKEFQKREYLTIHMRVHNDIRPYACDFCEKRFRSKSHYNNHRRLHTGEKPYVCHSCGRSFYSPQCLYNHLISHTGNKSAVCSTCGKAFRTSNDLKRHEYIHSGEKPFVCKFCGKCFNRRGNCLVHERAHEVDGAFKCDICNLQFEKPKKLEKHKQKSHPSELQNPKPKVSKGNSKSKGTKEPILSLPSFKSEDNKFLEIDAETDVPPPVAFIHLDDVASNVEISEGVLVDEGVEEPISLYQFAFEIDDNTLYCIQERRTDPLS